MTSKHWLNVAQVTYKLYLYLGYVDESWWFLFLAAEAGELE